MQRYGYVNPVVIVVTVVAESRQSNIISRKTISTNILTVKVPQEEIRLQPCGRGNNGDI